MTRFALLIKLEEVIVAEEGVSEMPVFPVQAITTSQNQKSRFKKRGKKKMERPMRWKPQGNRVDIEQKKK